MGWTNFAATGTASYGSVTFDPLYKSRVSSKPHFDDAGRTVVYVEHSIEIEAWVTSAATPGNGTDSTLTTMRQVLNTPGLELHYDNKGFGTLTVNAPGNPVKDVAWGPKPELLSFMPVADMNAAHVVWRVTTSIPECSYGSVAYQGKLLALNYEVEYTSDQHGLSTVTVNGYAEIPMTYIAQGNHTLPDDVDAYYEKVVPPIPPGFRRKLKSRRLSLDKRRLDFSFVDEELNQDGLPIGCTAATGRHTIRTDTLNSNRWGGTIAATYIVAQDQPKASAFRQFQALIRDRLIAVKAAHPKAAIIPLGFLMSEGIYEDMASTFEFSYTFTMPLAKILIGSGMWRPLPNTNANLWATSVAAVTRPRGIANLRHTTSMDAIVNLCSNDIRVISSRQPPPRKSEQGFTACFTALTPENSWMRYTNVLRPVINSEMVTHKPLDPVTLKVITDPNDYKWPVVSSNPDIVQQRTTPTTHVVMEGHAVRAGYSIPKPELFRIGNVVARIENTQSSQKIGAILGCAPIMVAKWRTLYRLEKMPEGVILTPMAPQYHEFTGFNRSQFVELTSANRGASMRTGNPNDF